MRGSNGHKTHPTIEWGRPEKQKFKELVNELRSMKPDEVIEPSEYIQLAKTAEARCIKQ